MFFQNCTFNHPTNLQQTQGVPLGQMFHCPKHGWELELSEDVGSQQPPQQKTLKKKGSHSLALGFMGRDSQRWSYWMKASQAPCSTSARRNRTFWKDLLKGLGQSVLFMNLMAKSHFLRNSFIVIQYLDTFVSSRVFHPRHIWRRPGDELKELLGFVKETMGRWDGEKHYVKMMVERFLAMITTTRLFFGKMKAQAIDKFWTTILDLLF